jgi:uncharacterized membrane protein YjjP (DUF1212 family)
VKKVQKSNDSRFRNYSIHTINKLSGYCWSYDRSQNLNKGKEKKKLVRKIKRNETGNKETQIKLQNIKYKTITGSVLKD